MRHGQSRSHFAETHGGGEGRSGSIQTRVDLHVCSGGWPTQEVGDKRPMFKIPTAHFTARDQTDSQSWKRGLQFEEATWP